MVIHNGVPTMIYSGVADMTLWSADDDLPPSDRQRIPQGYYHEFVLEIDQETQCIATSRDNLQTWQKQSANPVIPAIPDGLDLIGFRDPFLWKEDDGLWYMLLGSGIKGQGGVALLYRSTDMINWEYLNPLTIGDPEESGINWECPNFLALGEKHMLVVSPHGRPVYWLGDYANHRYAPDGPPRRLDWGDVFYAPNSLLDPSGRWLMWGWIREARPRDQYAAAGWASCLTLPREISLDAGGNLVVKPLRNSSNCGKPRYSMARYLWPKPVPTHLTTWQAIGWKSPCARRRRIAIPCACNSGAVLTARNTRSLSMTTDRVACA